MLRCVTERSPARAASPAPRRRLSAEDARERILVAAERKLGEVGPEGLRLTELAAELGVSHPAILHHFGNREGLMVAVVARAVGRLNERLLQAMTDRKVDGSDNMLDIVAEFYGAQGNARLIAWLTLSGRAFGKNRTRAPATRSLQRIIERSHALRTAAKPDQPIELQDTRFRIQLLALTLLGEAIFGDLVRFASGDTLGAEGSREFRRRLAKLLIDTA
jgi:AcrR family transcriptional regulator